MSNSGARVGVVLLNWNTGELTADCIRSLKEGSQRPWRILVFDNASTDGSPDRLERDFPEIQLVRNPTNQGFAPANNRAAEMLLADGAEYLWFLNNDTRVDRGCLEALWQELERDQEIAAASGKIFFMHDPDLIQYAGAFWRPIVLRAPFRGLGEKDRGQYDKPCDVGMLSGCCMFIRSSAWLTIGGFRENYFAYNEDTEWCLRAIQKGMRLRYVPSARLWHVLSAGMRKNFGMEKILKASPRQEYLQTRNSIFLNREHARRPFQLIISLTDNITRRLYRAAGLAVLGRWKSSAAILQGLADGFRQPFR